MSWIFLNLFAILVICAHIGTSCVIDADCSSGNRRQVCVSQQCVDLRSSNERCATSKECASFPLFGSAACREGTCASASADEPCIPQRQIDADTCARGLYCKSSDNGSGGICRPVKSQASPCVLADVVDGACGAGFTCNIVNTNDASMPLAGSCVPIWLGQQHTPCASSLICQPSLLCQNKRCTAVSPTAECALDSDCPMDAGCVKPNNRTALGNCQRRSSRWCDGLAQDWVICARMYSVLLLNALSENRCTAKFLSLQYCLAGLSDPSASNDDSNGQSGALVPALASVGTVAVVTVVLIFVGLRVWRKRTPTERPSARSGSYELVSNDGPHMD